MLRPDQMDGGIAVAAANDTSLSPETQVRQQKSVTIDNMDEKTASTRDRIVKAAAELLAQGGRDAVSTRAVSAAAGVQSPTLYRQFGDKHSLLMLVARDALTTYVRQMAAQNTSDDPVVTLRQGWDMHVAFGLANPDAYALIYGDSRTLEDTTTREDDVLLHDLVSRVARAGRLRVSVPHAVRLLAAGGEGVTLALISTPPESRDPELSAAMREAIFAAILVDSAPSSASSGCSGTERIAVGAVSLRALLAGKQSLLSAPEQRLLEEWLDRLAERQGQA